MKNAGWLHWHRRQVLICGLLVAGALVAVFFAVTQGAVKIPLSDASAIFLKPLGYSPSIAVDTQNAAVLWNIRLPRVLMGFLVGAVLAVCGACLQGLFRNPLADPGLVGISGGGAVAAVATIVFLPAMGLSRTLNFTFLPVSAFCGALLATFLIYRLASIGGQVRVASLLLAGIAVNALAGAGIGWMTYIATDDQLRMLTFWTLGSLSGSNWMQLQIVGPIIFIVLLLMPMLARGLNAMSLGEAEAGHLGFSVPRLKSRVVLLSALGVGAAVSVSGIIGFVGLVIPHLLRLMIGSDHRWIIPGSIFLGGGLMVFADLLARTIVMPIELPIGIVVATIGAPFFIYLMLREKSRLLS